MSNTIDIDQLDKEIELHGGFDNIFWESCKSKAWFLYDKELKNIDIYQRGLIYAFNNSPKKLHNVNNFIIKRPYCLIPSLVTAYKLFNNSIKLEIIKVDVSRAICSMIELLVAISPYYHTDLCVCKLCYQSKNISYGQEIDGRYMKSIIMPLNTEIITEINKMLSIDNYIDAIIFADELCKNSIVKGLA
jgi:hypothetical protein